VATVETSDLAELGYDLSRHALREQEASLDELRSRTGILLTATALVASFLGSRALVSDGSGWLDVLGLVAAVSSILFSVYVLLPKRNLRFVLDGAAVYEHFVEAEADLPEAHRVIAYWNRYVCDANQASINRLIRCFRWACVALIPAVVLWSSSLALN
jgi:hypothetical protein